MIKTIIMKNIISILLISLLFISCERKAGKRIYEHSSQITCICDKGLCDYCVKVIGITDGDTFKGLTDDKQVIRFRIYGIDTPEKKQAFSNKARQYLSDLIFEQTVGIKVQKKNDRYGRPVVWVYTAKGLDVSAEMLKAGMAWHYKDYDSTPEYAEYEIKAKKARLGLWADNNPVAPWDFKKKKK